jgi:tRNA-modifying protein YgfZ
MTADLFQQITTHGAAVNLSSHAKLRLIGADRVRYLNGQVTNDIRRVKPDETLYACVTDVKGRIAADVRVHSQDETLLLDAEPALREPLGMRLERYIVADDVELTDVTEDWQLWHFWSGAGTPACIESILRGLEHPHHLLRSARFGTPGLDLWLPASANAPTFDSLPLLTDADLETWRILQKIPRWPHELNAETFPPEAGLERQAMDFAKGCYIGQEVLSRIKTTGKMPREMIAFESSAAVNAGDELWHEKAVGKVTSVTQHPVTGQTIGLAMIRQGTPHESLRIGSSEGPQLRAF